MYEVDLRPRPKKHKTKSHFVKQRVEVITNGDLSIINRELAVQLAKLSNVEVSVFLLQCSEEDRNNAASHDVQLVVPEMLPGMNPVDCLMFVPDGHVMDCVVGHGVTLGRQVPVIRKHHQYKWIQVVHTAPEDFGMYKSISQGEQLQKTEVALCEKADQVVAIGPKLADAYKRYLVCSKKDHNVLDLTPGIFSEFLDVEQAIEERRTFSVLIIGSGDSWEDFILKGYDLAARAIAELEDEIYQLKFVGAPRGKRDEIAEILLRRGIHHSQLTVCSFNDRREVLANLFCEVDLAIMPSRTEEFGVNALEALSAGLPVLVSGNSGFGEALKEVPFGSECVIDSEDPKDWARKIKAVRQKKRSN
ncbi:D-inositol 3-phosphate glycosyltransferase [Stylophora pistillata]|uniref:D-inositol 3-phosphate glycosyltransferase n=1 Tax=Stylophora pistillata TaxID=50429 RepID=A0A2B4R9U4_STYPI|nr:D-inositol 3-phosphate glycosyltransferase [Stylophora pistillata]